MAIVEVKQQRKFKYENETWFVETNYGWAAVLSKALRTEEDIRGLYKKLDRIEGDCTELVFLYPDSETHQALRKAKTRESFAQNKIGGQS